MEGLVVDREALARRVVEGIACLAPKLATLAEDIRHLWAEFAALKPGETIMGCSTKKEFCEMIGRTPRAVRYMLAGGNPNRGEIVSPSQDEWQAFEQHRQEQWKIINAIDDPVLRALVTEQGKLYDALYYSKESSDVQFEKYLCPMARLEGHIVAWICRDIIERELGHEGGEGNDAQA